MNPRTNAWLKTSILATAVAAVPLLFTSSASAQYRVENDGRMLDANNRIGSGGTNANDSWRRVGEQVNGNDIVVGNVTGGREFHGHVPYTDPRAFRGQNSSNGLTSDNFIKNSSGPDSRMASDVTTFYGASRAVAPPQGYQSLGPGTGAYVPQTNVPARLPGDQRLGTLDLENTENPLPTPGQYVLPGPVDPTAGQLFTVGSPTAGIRTMSAAEINGFTSNTQYNPVGAKLDDAAIQRMRDELNQAAGGLALPSQPGKTPTTPNTTPGQPNVAPGALPNTPGVNPTAPGAIPGATPAAPGAIPTTPAAQQPGATPVVQQPVVQPINNAVAAVPGGANTNQGVYFIPPPEKQSTLLADLRDRYQQKLADQNLSDEDKARAFNEYQRAKANPTPGQPGAVPGQPGQPGQPGAVAAAPGATGNVAIPPAPGAATRPAVPDYTKRGEEILKRPIDQKTQKELAAKHTEPIKVPSLAKGIKGKGLNDYMQAAEAAMKDGKFTLAFEEYDKAEQIAPNNPLTRLGRANAELGASYYARAEAHLRDVFTNHPELLGAQYDLTSMLGEQRLKTIIKDLKEVAKKDTNEPRPLFLLSYIAYNTGHEQEALGYLDLADKRADGKNPFYKLLRENWSLPEKSTIPGANK